MWTDETRQIARDGYGVCSASLIGAEIGKSRNAVIGWWYRNGLSHGGGRKVMYPVQRKSPVVVRFHQKRIRKAAPMIDDNAIPIEQRKSLLELGPEVCRWPVGEVGQPGFFFCAAPKESGSSYCSGHTLRSLNVNQGESRRPFIPLRKTAA